MKTKTQNKWQCRCLQHFPVPDDWWTSGYCSIFAYALKRRFGLPVWAICEEARKDGHLLLLHAFGRNDDLVYDARGCKTFSNMLKEYEFEKCSDWGFHDWLYTGEDAEETRLVLISPTLEKLGEIHDEFCTDHTSLCAAHQFITRHPKRFRSLMSP